MHRVVIALGSNLGDRAAWLDAAVARLVEHPELTLTGVSRWVESIAHTPDGPSTDAPSYLNGVVLATTTLEPLEVLELLHATEIALGRPAVHEHWGDRTIDLDLVSVDDLIWQSERLTLPHPRAHERVFVLAPWAELDPSAVLPGRGAVNALLQTADPVELAALRPGVPS